MIITYEELTYITNIVNYWKDRFEDVYFELHVNEKDKYLQGYYKQKEPLKYIKLDINISNKGVEFNEVSSDNQ